MLLEIGAIASLTATPPIRVEAIVTSFTSPGSAVTRSVPCSTSAVAACAPAGSANSRIRSASAGMRKGYS